MPELSKTKACLRVMGDELLPDEISSLLGQQPTRSMTKGEPFSYNKNNKPRIARSGMWRLEAKDESPGDLDKQISEVLSQLTDDLNIWQRLSEKYTLDFFCGLFMEEGMEGISVSSENLLALGQRHILIDFDIYAPDD